MSSLLEPGIENFPKGYTIYFFFRYCYTILTVTLCSRTFGTIPISSNDSVKYFFNWKLLKIMMSPVSLSKRRQKAYFA